MKFLLKSLFIHLLVVLLVDGNRPVVSSFLIQSAFAEEEANAGQEELDFLFSSYAGLRNRRQNNAVDLEGITQELMSPRGQELLERGQNFLGDPANRALLATPSGQELAAMHNRFARLRKVKSQLDSCFTGEFARLNNPNMTQALPERVFAAAFATPEGSVPCDPNMFETQALDQLFAGVSDVVNSASEIQRVETLNRLQQGLSEKNFDNAVRSLVNLEITYSGADLTQGNPLSDRELDRIVNDVCSHTNLTGHNKRYFEGNCNRERRQRLRRIAGEKQAEMVAAGAQTYTPRSAADELRSRYENLNSQLMQPEFRLDIDYVRINEVDHESEQTQRAQANYVNAYMDIVRSHPGMLSLALSDELGGRRDQDQPLFGLFGGGGVDLSNGTFRPHNVTPLLNGRPERNGKTSGENTINRAISSARRSIMGQVSSAASAYNSVNTDMANYDPNKGLFNVLTNGPSNIVSNREENLTDLIKRNPASVGQLLMEEPGLASEACRIMRKVAEENEDEADGSWLKTALLVGGLALGAVALVGVGALIIGGGAMLLGAGGAATAAWGGAVLTSLAIPGLAYGAVEAGSAGYRWNQANQDRNALIGAYMAGGGDDGTVQEFFAAEEAASEAAWELGLALGFSVLDAPAAIAVARNLSRIPGIGLRGAREYLMDVSRMFNYVEGSPKLRSLFRGIKESMGINQFRQVFKEITKLDNGMAFMRKIEDLSLDEARELFRRAHTICERSCS